jgi:hypothetical protein
MMVFGQSIGTKGCGNLLDSQQQQLLLLLKIYETEVEEMLLIPVVTVYLIT